MTKMEKRAAEKAAFKAARRRIDDRLNRYLGSIWFDEPEAILVDETEIEAEMPIIRQVRMEAQHAGL
jgi:hypothetical protein